jgi:hypothetical protein
MDTSHGGLIKLICTEKPRIESTHFLKPTFDQIFVFDFTKRATSQKILEVNPYGKPECVIPITQ